jgi:AraC-like DNA-binding protein
MSTANLNKHFSIGHLENCPDEHNCISNTDYTLFVISQGTGLLNIDFSSLTIKAGRVFFVSPEQVIRFSTHSLVGYFITFDLDFYHSVKSIFKLYDFPFFHTLLSFPYLDTDLQSPLILSQIQHLMEEYSSTESFGKWSILRAGLENLLIHLTRIKQKQNSLGNDALIPSNEKLRKLELLIEQNFKTHKDIAFYAEKLNISSRHLNSIISQKTGKSISLMIQERTLREAKRQLLHSEKTILEIAYELGFNDKSYFHRFFKKFTSQTPSYFRKNS